MSFKYNASLLFETAKSDPNSPTTAPVKRSRLNSLISSDDTTKPSEDVLKHPTSSDNSSNNNNNNNNSRTLKKTHPDPYYHNFVDKTLSGPSDCKWCGKFIWVVNAESQCSQCDYTVHKSCKEEVSQFRCSGIKGCFDPFYVLKLGIMGPEGSGKKSLAKSHTGTPSLEIRSEQPSLYYRSMTRLYDRREFGVEIFTLPSSKSYLLERLDILKELDLAFLCFSISDPEIQDSFSILEAWKKEIVTDKKSLLFILVGMKADMRDPAQNPTKEKLISRETGEKYAKELGALKYMECSALTKVGVNNLFYWGVIELVKRLDQKQK